MPRRPTSRRRFLQLASSAALAAPAVARALASSSAPARAAASVEDGTMRLEFDGQLAARAGLRAGDRTRWLTARMPLTVVELADGRRIDQFALAGSRAARISGAHGEGTETVLVGRSLEGLELTLALRSHARYPGFVLGRVTLRNDSTATLALKSLRSGALHLLPRGADSPAFWSYSGGTYANRRDWLQPVRAGFAQDNDLGMTASDYGGGVPIVDVWRRDGGVAVGHLASVPELVCLPIRERDGGVDLALHAIRPRRLAPGERFEGLELLLSVHAGDHFVTLDGYRRLMDERGLRPPPPPAAAYEPIWCAWGYERACTTELIEATLPKVRELGLAWAVIDDGWQAAVGDWRPDTHKYPAGEADMRRLVGSIRGAGLKPRLWYAPLAAAPGSDLLHDRTELLLLDKEGAVQNISWWNSFYLCPAYEGTRQHTRELVRRFLGDWGYAGLKIDGQHLNGVAPCHNPAHRHARPEESVEGVPAFFRDIYETAMAINPQAVIELCPCGTAYSFYDFPYVNQVPASDPESSWQVRLKGKTLKALMGPSAPYAGDHVELSDHGDDFASTVGIGAVVSTKFTWPVDPKPKDSFLLTPEREALWRRWIGIYRDKRLPEGTYLGGLYDIGFDKPETHVVERAGRRYYAFYAKAWQGPLTLRGLPGGEFRVHDYFRDRPLGTVSRERPVLEASFERFLLVEVSPA
ncbi:MAG: alpha-galactosidase [Proteobacteria bacterium]|nr:alpha-galactosidase [Pseudomonadota bacterium]